jgi:hypothetical protein
MKKAIFLLSVACLLPLAAHSAWTFSKPSAAPCVERGTGARSEKGLMSKRDLEHHTLAFLGGLTELPRGEGTRILDRRVDPNLRFDNQGVADEYPGHHHFQIQYKSGRGCYASMIIQDGAPMSEIMEVVKRAIREPLFNHRLYNDDGAAPKAGAGGGGSGAASSGKARRR